MIRVVEPTKTSRAELMKIARSVLKRESSLTVVWTPHLIIKCVFQSFCDERGESKTTLNSFFLRPELDIDSKLSLFRPNLLKFKTTQLEESDLVGVFKGVSIHLCESTPVNLNSLESDINARISIIRELIPRVKRDVIRGFRREVLSLFFSFGRIREDFEKTQYSRLVVDELAIKFALNLSSLPERIDLKAVDELYAPYLLISSGDEHKFLFLVKTGGIVKKFREDVVLSRIACENDYLKKYFMNVSLVS